jgi:hypothetical protein
MHNNIQKLIDKSATAGFFREGNLDILADFFFRPGLTMSKDRTTIEPLRSRLAFRGMP